MLLSFFSLAMGIAVAALSVLAFMPGVKVLATRAGAVRHPRERDVHREAVPLWGGLAIYAGFILTVMLYRAWQGQPLALEQGAHPVLGILLGGSLIALMGMLDDRYDLPPWMQAGGLLGGGLLAALCGVRIDGITNPMQWPAVHGTYRPENYLSLGGWSIPITMLWVFLVAKTLDFLDGLDGLAAGVCLIAATTMGLVAVHGNDVSVALLAGAVGGASLGFLRHNYHPASIFMGTVGAQFLGFMLACLAVVGAFKIPATISVMIPPLVLGVPVFDGLFVVARRMVRGQKPTVADRTSHVHHRLLSRGLTTVQAVWAIYGMTAVGCLAALILAWD